MKTKFLLAIAVLVAGQANAQLPEDAIRMSWNIPSGTARQQAIGGAMGSLGGEITSVFVNPAGLGMYKTGEVVLSPGFSLQSGRGIFLGNEMKTGMNSNFHFGTSGVVWSQPNQFSRWGNKAFSLAVNRTANFNRTTVYSGVNDFSSFTEPLANEFFDYYINRKAQSPNIPDATIVDDALNSFDVSLLTKMGLYTYLIDIDSSDGQSTVISRAEQAGILNQQNRITTNGGITEIAFGFASSMQDQLYLGASIGIPIVNYGRRTEYTETDEAGTGNNEFSYTTYTEDYTSKGLGVNARLGLIFKPVELVRIGLSVHTPTLYGLSDNFSSTLITDIDTATGSTNVFQVDSRTLNGGVDPNFKYDIRTPWRLILSGSYVFQESSDVQNQRGFITADVEYLNYGGSRFAAAEIGAPQDLFSDLNRVVQDIYGSAFNFRVGGELKFNTFMTRLGFAWYGSPYEDAELKARRMNLSGGVGYRNRGVFVDLTYVHSMTRDVNFPYRLEAPRQNVFSDIRENMGNVLLTVGMKF